MKNFKLKNLLIFLNGIILFESCFYSSNKLFAKNINKIKLKQINRNYDQLVPKNDEHDFDLSIAFELSKFEVLNDLLINGDKLFNLLAFEQNENDLKKKYFVDINSDIQYREKEVFHAEGNAIIYLSNATLKGDLIKYDLEKKLLTVLGNVIFKKGEQYFEASKLYFDLKEDTGYIDNIYGVIDNKTFLKDFKLKIDNKYNEPIEQNDNDQVSQPRYLKNSKMGRLRYKTDKLIYNSGTLKSKKIFLTNDIYNDPQIIFLSKNFSAEIVDDNLKLLSRNSWIILDKKLKIPIGRRTLFEGEDSFTESWEFGADYKDKDGYYFSRGLYPRKLFKDYNFQLKPYFLIQRAIKGSTNSFRASNSSIFSKKVKSDIKFSDYFALDLDIKGEKNYWDVESKIQLNSLNTERLAESLRTKLVLKKRINLNSKTKDEKDLIFDENISNFISLDESNNSSSNFGEEIMYDTPQKYQEKDKKVFNNFLDLNFYNIFREQVIKDFATEDIYFATGFNITNKKTWSNNYKNSNLKFIYDVGHFKSKSNTKEEFKDLFRNTFVAEYNHQFPLWKKRSLDKSIDNTYKYSPEVILQSLNWSTGLQKGLFLYSDGSNQSALKFNTGPVLTFGSFKEKFINYTKFSANYTYVLKGGDSPFSFDNINKDPRINFNLQQQIYGPLLISLDTILNLNNGTYSNFKYGLDFKRRAYSIGAFYNSSNESLGLRFNIFNFDYSGLNKKF